MYEFYAKARDRKGLNDLAVCKAIGMSPAAMSDWKNGKTKALKSDTLKKISDYLDVSMEYLMTGEIKVDVEINDYEKELIRFYRRMSEYNKRIITDTARALSERSEND